MGGAATVGLGLAIAQPARPVMVITGDGELLMGSVRSPAIGVQRPANLTIAVLDNERYAETGGQHSHTAAGVRIDGIAAACGFAWTAEVRADASRTCGGAPAATPGRASPSARCRRSTCRACCRRSTPCT